MESKAFTLIEVLVVMTIIGVLSSLVLVSFSGQRERAKLTKAQNFDAQVSHSLGAYAVGIWRFEEGSGTTIYDASGFDNDGTLGDGTCVPGAGTCPDFVGSGVYSGTTALQFDGINDYVDIADSSSLDITDAITVEAWVRPNFENTDASSHFILDKTVGNTEAFRLMFDTSIDDFRFRLFTGGGAINCDTQGLDWTVNTWHHILGTYNGSEMKIYWDGIEKNSANQSGTITRNNDNLTIGSDAAHSNWLDGSIDNVSIYDVALPEAQIQQHYATGAIKRCITMK